MLFKLLLLLSIIIVSYNVQYFIEQCLYSIQRAIEGIETEVIVVDNNSADKSVACLQQNFPWVQLIVNKENKGYASANNQGLQAAKGSYVLFLNPDTIIGEDCLGKSIEVLEQHDMIGALGIRMIDGTGRFLPESKRGFPSPKASFFKLSGFIKSFPQNKTIGRYYLGWLPEKENHEVEVLSGAYMMIKREVLEKTGCFDEQFFMYGEDIDLSYRIHQAGYKNYYLGEKAIVHFKGESTRKDIRYTRLFYKAMNIFVQKHYRKKSRGFALLMHTAIGFSSGVSFIGRVFRLKAGKRSNKAVINSLLVGSPADTAKAARILSSQSIQRKIIQAKYLTEMYKLKQTLFIDEVVFCAGSISYAAVIDCMEACKGELIFRFFAAGSNSIVGSTSKKSSGEVLI